MGKSRIFSLVLSSLVLASTSLAFGSPTISLSPTSITANTAGNCAGNPAAQNVTISNSGNGTLATPTFVTSYSEGNGWLNPVVTGSSAPYTLQVNFQNTCSLANGTYNATIQISSSGASNSPVNLSVTLTVGPVSSPAISLSPTSLTFNGEVGGSNPAAQDVSVSNSGGGSLASPTTSITYGSGSGWLSVQTQGSSAPYTLVNQTSISGLSAGTYTATVKVSSSGASNSPQSYTVTLVVASSGSPTISLSPSGLTANMSGTCSGNPATQDVTISNAGGGTLSTPTFQTSYSQGSGWLNPSITGSSAPYTMQVEFQNTCGLALGTYKATIAVSSSGATNSPVNLPVTLQVGSSSSPTISLSPNSLSFSGTVGGSNPAAQDVTVSNSGGGTLASPTTSITYGSGSGWLSVSGSGSGPYTLSNQVTVGSLAAGTYTATVKVSSSGATNTPQSYSVTLTVSSSSVCTSSSLSQGINCSYAAGTYPADTENAIEQTDVDQDVFGSDITSQTLYSTNPGDWYVTANLPTGNESVESFPDVWQQYNGEEVDSFTSLIGSFSETVPDRVSNPNTWVQGDSGNPNIATDIGFDTWYNVPSGMPNEVMIQHDMINRGGQCGPIQATVTFGGGSNGVPQNTWVLCIYGTEMIWQIQQPSGSSDPNFGFQTGSVDIKAMIDWLETHDNPNPPSGATYNTWLPSNVAFTSTGISYGFELCSTGGVNENFEVNSFSVTESPAP
jgi:uncharacterized membrane protein